MIDTTDAELRQNETGYRVDNLKIDGIPHTSWHRLNGDIHAAEFVKCNGVSQPVKKDTKRWNLLDSVARIMLGCRLK